MDYKLLFSPMKIGNCEIKNRIVMPPMMLGFGQFDGTPTQKMEDYYEERAKGGAGLIITEITRVDDFSGASAFAQLGLSHDYQIEPLKRMIDKIHRHDCKLFVQLHHPGRQNLGLMMGTVPLSNACRKIMGSAYDKMFYKIAPMGKKMMEKDIVLPTWSPSKVERAYSAESLNREMSVNQIEKIIREFADAALRAKKAGADGVELHAAHGYLIQQFLSPFTNRRTDKYGGSLENRMRFLLEIVAAIRAKCGSDFPLVVRLSVDECYAMIGQEGKGYTLEDGVKMAEILDKNGVDAIDVSCAGYDTYNYWLEPVSFEPGWRKYMAKAVKEKVSVPVLAANLIRSPKQAEEQLEEGIQDFVCLGRSHIADPHWAQKVKNGEENLIKRCICCLYCMESMQHNAYKGSHANCSVNPLLGHERYALKKDGNGRKVLVIGAGVAGLTAAQTLAERGFSVKVYEKCEKPGGQVTLAAQPPKKEKIYWCVEDLAANCSALGVEIIYNTAADGKLIESEAPYAVFVATGGAPVIPRSIEGTDGENVCTAAQVLDGTVEIKDKKVAVIGSGMTGLETAEYLCGMGNRVCIVEMADSLAPGTWMQHIDDAVPKLKACGTKFLTSSRLVKIGDGQIEVESTKSKSLHIEPADFVVLSLGVKPVNELESAAKAVCGKVCVIGDASKCGRIADATASAFKAAATL